MVVGVFPAAQGKAKATAKAKKANSTGWTVPVLKTNLTKNGFETKDLLKGGLEELWMR